MLYRALLPALLVILAGCAALPPEKQAETAAPAPVPAAVAAVTQPAPASAPAAPVDTRHRYTDLWERIRAGYRMPSLDSPYTARHARWFANNPEYMANMVERARFYLYYIVEEVEKRGMPLEIALLPAIESAYQPNAYSRARAVGLWQFIAPTGRLYGLKMNWWYDGRRDVIASTQAALDYLEKLVADFNGDWQLALAAYNCGEGKVARQIEVNRRRGKPTGYQHLRLPRETVNYVPKLMAMADIVSDPARFGLKLEPIPDSPYFARVETDTQIDLGVVARLTDMPVNELFQINPGYSRWVTDPEGPHALLVPADRKDMLIEGLNNLSDDERVQWARHEVRHGETLSALARRYHVTADAIRTTNQLPSNVLRVGQNLLIPASASRAQVAGSAVRPDDMNKLVMVEHRVRSGDTLGAIARRYRVYVSQLREWNRLASNLIRLGQVLEVWVHPSRAAALAGNNPG